MSTALKSINVAKTAAKRVTAGQPRRMMSGSTPEEIYTNKEMWLKTTTLMMGGMLVPFTAFIIYKEMTHHHPEEAVPYPHLRIRRKAFPWAANDCALFDMKCRREFAKSHMQ